MFLGQKFPKSEAAEKGASFIEMFRSVGILGSLVACYLLALFFGDIFKSFNPENAKMIGYGIGGLLLIIVSVMTNFSIGSFLLFVLFVVHAMVGAVELGTDGWIQNITGNLFNSEEGKYLFIWTSSIMFGLRFCAHFIETKLKLSPIGLLLVCAGLACLGLNLASGMQTFSMALVALGIYAVGKTFFWPTMLAVVGDRYPQTGAVAMSIMGGIGMLSAGLIGGPGLGYCKDRFAGEELNKTNPAIYAEYKAKESSTFLNLASTEAFGLDGKKLGEANDKLGAIRKKIEAEKGDLNTALSKLEPNDRAIIEASTHGDRATLKADAYIPLTMAAIYLILLVYFQLIGGYKPVSIGADSGK
jgi:hypothetical protein